LLYPAVLLARQTTSVSVEAEFILLSAGGCVLLQLLLALHCSLEQGLHLVDLALLLV
jgi:hypothetical protein